MTPERTFVDDLDDPRMQAAIRELQDLIRAHYPDATFATGYGEGPDGVHLDVTVDLEDTDEVVDVYIERLLDFQIDDGLALYVIPIRPPERRAAMLRARNQTAQASATAAG